jgi:hypothetical protein
MTRSILRGALALIVVVVASMPGSASAAKRLVFKDEFVVEGEIQKPEVAVFISRQNLNKGYELALTESFLPKILESVDKAPF